MSLIYLVGPRACGKATLGKALSGAGRALLRYGPPPSPAPGHGRGDHGGALGLGRASQPQRILRLASEELEGRGVVATGGGMVLAEANRRYMLSMAGSLSAPAEVLAARLRRNPLEAQRPSLTGKSLDDEVREVLEARLPCRDAAHHELDARQSITDLCLAVRTLLRH